MSAPERTPDSVGFYDDSEGGLPICRSCGSRSLEHNLGEFLSHLLEVPLEEGQTLQARIVMKLAEGL